MIFKKNGTNCQLYFFTLHILYSVLLIFYLLPTIVLPQGIAHERHLFRANVIAVVVRLVEDANVNGNKPGEDVLL